ncbi:ubl carboxyl-terminal hydrolase 18 isoform X2 [Pantherophis guttatus]|uniref:Ubl carboxyl-terminal hydrolase 18 isoform X2 n=1 Tax=Pantherophis guttatus TaxID=94885 RepID=A0A6P9AMP8_PANGU|nr:ubl carboxyl-terminal hydrolase 18 isoform X2 [Pantherophis guttatus]
MPAQNFMGQKSGHPKEKRSPKLYGYQILVPEEQEESNEKESNEKESNEKGNNKDLEKISKQFDEILGMADSRNGAVGLYNIGLNCCVNSLLQSFLMNRYFTSLLRRISVPFGTAERKANVPYQMLLLLESMQRAKGKSVHPFDLIYCLSRHGVRLFVLHDASEIYYKIWNLLKSQITNTDLVERLTDLYTIRLQEFLMCQKCSHEIKINNNQLMLHLPMFDFDSHQIVDLENSLHCFFRPEQLTRENICHCEKCNKKTPCLRRVKIMNLPQMLTLHLVRFRSKDGNRTKKVTHSLAFPPELNFSQILTSEQYQPDAKKKSDGLYDLFAVIAHSGPADFGHYCAYIWSLTESKWYCFNDSSVCEVSWDDIKCTYGRQSLRWGETAYLLVYMRKNSTSL